jgi:flagellar hook protein FlgE
MDVIANNIANVNTDGFKSQRATFADAFYQNIQGASGPNPDFGRSGTNPKQIGLGLSLASIDNLMHQGMARRTDRPFDVAIEGNGFLIVQDRGGANLFTRAGRLELDAHGNMHIGGNMLMGWGTRPDVNTPGGHAVERGLLQPIRLGGDKLIMPAESTTRLNIEGNLNTSQLSWDEVNQIHFIVTQKTLYDSLGNEYSYNIRMELHGRIPHPPPDGTPNGAPSTPHTYWTMEILTEAYDPSTGRPPAAGVPEPTGGWPRGVRATQAGTGNVSYLGICLFGGSYGTVENFADQMVTRATVAFNSNGDFVGMGQTTDAGAPMPFLHDARANTIDEMTAGLTWARGRQFDFSIVPVFGVTPSSTFGRTPESHPISTYSDGVTPNPPVNTVQIAVGTLSTDFSALVQRGNANTFLRALRQDGGGPGTIDEYQISGDGTIIGIYSNGRTRVLGQIPQAFFSNPAGLERVGNSFWRTSANSGEFDGVGLIGVMQGGALEGSNVDLANEFTEMITTQRGFQAASRTITVSDEMLQELVNLRR